jgi:hypothetical protein
MIECQRARKCSAKYESTWYVSGWLAAVRCRQEGLASAYMKAKGPKCDPALPNPYNLIHPNPIRQAFI